MVVPTLELIVKNIWDVEVTSFHTIIRINIWTAIYRPNLEALEKKARGLSLSLS